MRGYFSLIEQWRYRLLFAMLLATIFLHPLLDGFTLGRAILVVAYSAILSGGVYATLPKAWFSALYSALAFFMVSLSWYFLYIGPSRGYVALVLITLLFGIFTVTRTLITLVSAPATDTDALAGAIFGYFLLVVVWALFYRALNIWSPGAFVFTTYDNQFTELLYFSLITITTLGYGDIVPVNPFARISAGLEAAMGTLYIAILIARIIGALNRRSD